MGSKSALHALQVALVGSSCVPLEQALPHVPSVSADAWMKDSSQPQNILFSGSIAVRCMDWEDQNAIEPRQDSLVGRDRAEQVLQERDVPS